MSELSNRELSVTNAPTRELNPEHLALMLRLKEEIDGGKYDFFLKSHLPRLTSNTNTTRSLKKSINHTRKSGGGFERRHYVMVLFAIVFIISFSVEYSQARENFEAMLIQPMIYWDNVMVPFFKRLQEMNTDKQSLATMFFGRTITTILIPTLKGVYKKVTESLTGDALALNGLWSLWTNMIKFKDYIHEPKNKTEITPEKMKKIYEAGLQDIEHIIFYITVPKDFKLYTLPYGSKLLTHKNICD